MKSKKYLLYENERGDAVDISPNTYIDRYFKGNVTNQNKVLQPLPITWLEIDLSQLKKNYRKIVKHVGPGVGVISVIKANAYGHGLIPIAKTLEGLKTCKIGLASIEEVQLIKNNKIKTPTILLYPPLDTQLELLLDLNTEITMNNIKSMLLLNKLAKNKKKIAKIHIQINTGLNRYGVNTKESIKFIISASKLENIKIEGIWTHFTNTDNNKSLTKIQFNKFLKILKQVSVEKINIPYIHCANSAAISDFKESYDNNIFAKIIPSAKVLVRPGCLLYGTFKANKKNDFFTHPIISSMISHVTDVTEVEKGSSIGYFEKYFSQKRLKIATVPVGWGNTGYICNNAIVLLNNRYSKSIGVVSSNNLSIDITSIKNCKIGTKIFLIKKYNKKISLESVSRKNNMFLNYFISSLGSKVKKVYFSTD